MFSMLATPAVAQAQAGPWEEPAVSIYGGLGELTLYRGDLDVRDALGGEVGVRWPLSERVRMDLSFGQFHNRESLTAFDVPLSSPTTLLGRADRLDQRTDHRSRTADVVVLATGGVGRVRVAGGGGVGLIVLARTFRQMLSGCSAGATQFCNGETRTDFTTSSVTGIGLGTVDIRLTSRVSVYGAGRFALVLRDVASSGLRVTGGVRIAF
jgi:hypothetical protein